MTEIAVSSTRVTICPVIISIEVTMSLPDWVTGEKFEETQTSYYPSGHIWAGQVMAEETRNTIFQALFDEIEGQTETCEHPMGPWVKYSIGSLEDISALKEQISKILSRFEEVK